MTSNRHQKAKEIQGMKRLLLDQQRDLKQACVDALERCTTDEDLNKVALSIHVFFGALEAEADKVVKEQGPMAGLKFTLKGNEEILEQIKALP